VADPATADALFKALEEEFGPVLVLVNNAGVRADGLAPMIDDEDWDRVLDTNLSAAFRLTRRALRPMIRSRYGRVINISSIVGAVRGNAGQANYAASKAGLVGFSKAIAREVASRQITVNVVAPGLIATDMTQALTDKSQGDWSAQIPLGRIGTAEDVAGAVCFLASDEASYITGQVLAVNGGMYT
jgi:3-oxoacyl-[acyl-carrier protein] reductase